MSRSIDPDDLTGPERATARHHAKPLREKVKACGGCFCCTLRDRETEGWDRALCGLKPPQVFQKPGCTFQPDYGRIYRGRHEQE